jgi:hypothetical protein
MSVETIYVSLLDEGTDAFRPVVAERIKDGTFLIQGNIPSDERWAFRPGERVVVKPHVFSDGTTGLLADRRAIEEGSALDSWEAAELEIEQTIAGSSEPFDEVTIRNTQKFLSACRSRVQTPIGVAKGYWSTICVSWDDVEVEILDDRFELYEFHTCPVAIEYFDMSPGGAVPGKLIERLPCLKIEG